MSEITRGFFPDTQRALSKDPHPTNMRGSGWNECEKSVPLFLQQSGMQRRVSEGGTRVADEWCASVRPCVRPLCRQFSFTGLAPLPHYTALPPLPHYTALPPLHRLTAYTALYRITAPTALHRLTASTALQRLTGATALHRLSGATSLHRLTAPTAL